MDKRFSGLDSVDPGKSRKESKSYLYLFSFFVGIALCVLLIIGFKVSVVVAKAMFIFVNKYWLWIILGIVGLLLLRKILSRKHVEVHREGDPYY